MKIITLEDVKNNEQVKVYINLANDHLNVMGFTEHGVRHSNLVSTVSKNILVALKFPERICELAAIAGYIHDIGNVVARASHWEVSAILASQILSRMGMSYEEIGIIIGAVGNHDEHTGEAVNPVAAALIIADKGDVHRSRVRNSDLATFDTHDRVNYAVEKSEIKVDAVQKTITLKLDINTKICPVMEYFEIFLSRMVMCRRAAKVLNCTFGLCINDVKLL